MHKRKSVLGRGLSAILKDPEMDITTKNSYKKHPKVVGKTHELLLKNIELNPFQPRSNFNQEKLNGLANSIKELGIIQPITVRKLGYNKYQVISGERRLRACKILRKESVPCFVRIANDKEMLEMALIENIQRLDLNPIEIALSFKRLIIECKLTQEKCSNRVGKNRSTITNFLRLLKLPDLIQVGLKENVINVGHARALINIKDEESQLNIYQDIITHGFSVREVEQIARTFSNLKYKDIKKTKNTKKSYLSFAEQKQIYNLAKKIGSPVEIIKNKIRKGRIIIKFDSEEQLSVILKKINS